MDQLPRLQRWLAEYGGGESTDSLISIVSTDDPGWSVLVSVGDTPFAERAFEPIDEEPDAASGLRWLSCSLESGIWVGTCDPSQLARLLDIFLDWVSGAPTRRL
jgi:hypothetical protein